MDETARKITPFQKDVKKYIHEHPGRTAEDIANHCRSVYIGVVDIYETTMRAIYSLLFNDHIVRSDTGTFTVREFQEYTQ